MEALENSCKLDKEQLQNKYERIKRHNQKLETEIKKVKLSNKSLKKAIQNLKNDDVNAAQMPLEKQKQLLGKVFTSSQVKALYQQRSRRKLDDMCIGYTLLRMSNRRFYKYLTEDMHLPLPGHSTITRWANLKNEDSNSRTLSEVDKKDKEAFDDIAEDNEENMKIGESTENNSEDEIVTIMMVQDGKDFQIKHEIL